MKHILLIPSLFCLSLPAQAQETAPDLEDLFERFQEFSESTKGLLEGWIDEIGPGLEKLGPKLEALSDQIGDWNQYQAPEVLENGDIIIRRKPVKPDTTPEIEPKPDDAIDL